MNPVLRTLETWSTHQDYLWFIAALAWGAVAGAEWPRKVGGKTANEGKSRRWLLVLALSAVVSAGLELALLAQDIRVPYTKFDAAMGAAQAVSVVALSWPVLTRLRVRWLAWALAIAGASVLSALRIERPIFGGATLALLGACSAWHAVRGVHTGRRWRDFDAVERRTITIAFGMLALWPTISTHGPLAAIAHEPRIETDFSHFALFAVATLAISGSLLALSFLRQRLRLAAIASSGNERWQQRDFRRSLILLGVWLAAGLALAIWNGRVARRAFEESLLQRVSTAAALMDRDTINAALGPELKVTKFVTRRFPSGRPVEVAITPHSKTPAFDRLRQQLAQIRAANPGVASVFVEVFHAGKIFYPATDDPGHRPGESVAYSRPVENARLAESRPFLEGPYEADWEMPDGTRSEIFFARAPLRAKSDESALGWLVFTVSATRWTVSFTQARLQAMGFAGLGVVLWGVMLAYRLRREDRLAAERKAAAAMESDRLKSAFLTKVSHELRTPIQSVLGYGELLEQAPLADRHHRWLDALKSHGEVMLRLVNDLLDLGALQAGAFRLRPTTVNLPALVTDCAAALRLKAEAKGLQLNLELARELPTWVETDPVRLRQILFNLLGNAVKFTPSGRVSLVARCAAVQVGEKVQVEFVVSDTGPGISAEHRAMLFQPFSRPDTAAAIEGTGLGLSLVAGLCTAMEGSVRCLDPNGLGATFVVALPLRVHAAPYTTAAGTGSNLNYRGLRIVVAEDNTLVRELMVEFLRSNGADVIAVGNGAAAVAACSDHPPHAVILDIAMPEMDGFAAARAIRRLGAAAPRLIGVSAHAQPEDEARARAAGMDCFLVKPVSLSQLDGALRGVACTPTSQSAGGSVGSATASTSQLYQRLRAQFNHETPALIQELHSALRTGDWERIRSRAHYLKNSADVLGARELQSACQALSQSTASDGTERTSRLLLAVETAARLPFATQPRDN